MNFGIWVLLLSVSTNVVELFPRFKLSCNVFGTVVVGLLIYLAIYVPTWPSNVFNLQSVSSWRPQSHLLVNFCFMLLKLGMLAINPIFVEVFHRGLFFHHHSASISEFRLFFLAIDV